MGCHMCQTQHKNQLENYKKLNEQGNRNTDQLQAYYVQQIANKHYLGAIYDNQEQCIILKINNNQYKLILETSEGMEENMFKSKFRVYCDQVVYSHQNSKCNYMYEPRIYKHIFKINPQEISQANGIISLRQNSKKQDIVLIYYHNEHLVKIKSLKLKKLIVRYQVTRIFQFLYDQVKNYLILFANYNEQEFIDIINMQNRCKLINQPFENVKSLLQIQSTNDILLNTKTQGLVLYKINYINKTIERQKIVNIYYKIHAIIVDDDNLLNLISKDFYLKLDKDYNIIKKYRINFKKLQDVLQPKGRYGNNNDQQNLFCLNRQGYEFNFMQTQSNNQQDLIKYNCLTEFQNYQMEYIHSVGPIQHLISQNQRYLTFKIEQNLIFYQIQENKEQQLFHNKKINFLNFSTNSNYLYVVLEDKVICYKSKQNLKIQNQQHLQIKQLSSNQNGILVTINDKGKVRAISKQYQKLIFKLDTIQSEYNSFEYQTMNGILLISSKTQISSFRLIDRKPIINKQMNCKQCKIIQNTDNIFILTESECIELWFLNYNFFIFCREIISNIQAILEGYSNKYCFINREFIIILDQNFDLIEQIQYQYEYISDNLIDNYSQIIQENYILRVNTNESFRSSDIIKILITLDARENENL